MLLFMLAIHSHRCPGILERQGHQQENEEQLFHGLNNSMLVYRVKRHGNHFSSSIVAMPGSMGKHLNILMLMPAPPVLAMGTIPTLTRVRQAQLGLGHITAGIPAMFTDTLRA
jgi:hypothetical protein